MAYIENKVINEKGNPVLKHLMLVVVSGLTMVGVVYFFNENREADISAILMVVLVVGVLTIFVSKRLNPMAWKKFLNRKEFDELMIQEEKVNHRLADLDDSYFIFCNFTFELFYVDHLVVSENGIFLIGRLPNNEKLSVVNNTLFAGDVSLETLTARLWRVCHLLNIIIRKGFNELEVMPVPVLVTTEGGQPSMAEFKGIAITSLENLNDLITKKLKFKVPGEEAEGFAVYLKQRYM